PLQLAWDLQIARVWLIHDAFDRHGQSIPREDFAVLRETDEINSAPQRLSSSLDRLFGLVAQRHKEIPGKDLAAQQAISDNQRVRCELKSADSLIQDCPLAQIPVHQNP